MPFARHISFVTGRLHQLGPGLPLGGEFPHLALHRMSPPQVATGLDHGAGGHANGSAPSAHVIGVHETDPRFRQAVEMRGMNGFVAMGSHRFVALIVGKNEEDIGLFI